MVDTFCTFNYNHLARKLGNACASVHYFPRLFCYSIIVKVASFSNKHWSKMDAKTLEQIIKNFKTKLSVKTADKKSKKVIKSEVAKCAFCGQKFGENFKLLKLHLVTFHGSRKVSKKVSKCGILDRKLVSSHAKVHCCDICGKKFGPNDDQVVHYKLVHEERKPFKCDLCGIRFALPVFLKAHFQRVHTFKLERA